MPLVRSVPDSLSVHDIQMIHESLRTVMPEILNRTAAKTVYEARSFEQLL